MLFILKQFLAKINHPIRGSGHPTVLARVRHEGGSVDIGTGPETLNCGLDLSYQSCLHLYLQFRPLTWSGPLHMHDGTHEIDGQML